MILNSDQQSASILELKDEIISESAGISYYANMLLNIENYINATHGRTHEFESKEIVYFIKSRKKVKAVSYGNSMKINKIEVDLYSATFQGEKSYRKTTKISTQT